MRVEWYPEAEADLDEIVRYIFQDNPAAAFQLEDLLLNAARNLSATPEMGRVGRVFGTGSWLFIQTTCSFTELMTR